MAKILALVVALVVVVVVIVKAVTPQHAFDRRDVVIYRLDQSRREVIGMQPDAEGRMLYELAPLDDDSPTIWAPELDLLPAD